MGSRERALSQMGRGLRNGGRRRGRERMKTGMKMCYVHIPTSHKEFSHYVLHASANKLK